MKYTNLDTNEELQSVLILPVKTLQLDYLIMVQGNHVEWLYRITWECIYAIGSCQNIIFISMTNNYIKINKE